MKFTNQTTVTATALGGAVSVVIVWIVSGPVGVDVPVTVAAAFSTISAALVGLVWPS